MKSLRSIIIWITLLILITSVVEPVDAQRRKARPATGPEVKPLPAAILEATDVNSQKVWAQIYAASIFNLYRDARDPELIYATTPFGLYKTTEKGFRWTFVFAPPFPDQQSLAQSHVEYYPPSSSLVFAQSKSSPGLMFLGANWSGDRWPALWKSEDGGASWSEASAGLIKGDANSQQMISDIRITPKDPPTVYLTIGYEPIYKTLNKGKSWGAIGQNGALSINPASPDNLIVQSFYEGRNAWESHDGGLTWEKRAYPVRSMVIHPANPDLRFGSDVNPFKGCDLSEDGGKTWTNIAANDNNGVKECLGFDAKSDQIIYAGNQNGIYLSGNRGRSWRKISDIAPSSLAVVSQNVLYAAAAGGIWKTSDGGDNWHRANFTLPVLTGDRLCWIDDLTGTIYVGSKGGYFTTNDGGFNWQWNAIGDKDANILSISVAADKTMFLKTMESEFYTGPSSSLIRVTPEGKLAGVAPPSYVAGYADQIAASNADPRFIYFGKWISDDAGFSWREVGLNVDPRRIRVIISPASPKVAYVLDYSGPVFATANGGDSWTQLPSVKYPGVFVPDPKEPTTVYAILANKLSRSRDAGMSWDVLADLSTIGDFEHATPQFAVSPSDPNTFYLASGAGFLESSNAGKTWRSYHRGLNGDSISLFVVSKTMILGQGRNGIYRLSDDKFSWAVGKWEQYEKVIVPPQ